jgi:hemerythrin-like domain-containing protein
MTSSTTIADVRVFTTVHNAFRLATTRLVQATEALEPTQLRPVIGPHWAFYAAVLHHHHDTEDHSIFPALVAHRPDLRPLLELLSTDHDRLIVAMGATDAAVAAFAKQPDREHQHAAHNAMVAVQTAFFPHLDIEDAEILPAISASIPAKEWDHLDKAALRSIPRRYLPAAVGALDEVIRALPQDQRPAPPPPPIRIMLALAWRRRWAEWTRPLLA